MLTFQKIRWKNLLSYGDRYQEFNFLQSNATLLVGVNGSGKSILLDALTLALFNKPYRKITKPLLISNVNEKDCVVQILFETNGKQYKVTRSLKPAKFEIAERKYDGDIDFDNWDSGNTLDQTVTGEQQKFLESSILKMNYLSFIQVVVLGKAKYVSFFALDHAKRRTMVEEMLSSTIFGEMNKLLKSRIVITTNKLTEIGWEIESLETKINLMKNHIYEIEDGNKVIVGDIEKEIEKLQLEIEKLETKQDELDIEHGIHSLAIEKIASCNKELKKITTIKSKLESKRTYILKDIDFFNSNDVCPKCSQELSEETKTKSITSLEGNIDALDGKLTIVGNKLVELEELVEKYDNLVTKQNNLWVENNTVTTTIANLKQQENSLNSQIDKLQSNFDVKSSFNELLVVTSDYNELLNKKALLLVEESVSLDLLKILGDDGAKLLLIKKYIPIFNKYINYYLGKMGLNISFTLDENFNEKILARYRDKSCYYSFSEGEKLRIDLAMLLTWRTVSQLRNSVNTNLLVLDEIFDSSLDLEGVEGFIDALKDFGDMNVIVVSHTPDKLNKWAKRILRASIDGNFSTLNEVHNEI